MQNFLKLLVGMFVAFALAGCGTKVLSQGWKDRPAQKIDQLSLAWISHASDDWGGQNFGTYVPKSDFAGAGIPPEANALDYGKIGDYFKNEGAILLRAQGFTGVVEANDSQKGMIKIIQTAGPQQYWMIFEAATISSTCCYGGTWVTLEVKASLKDMRTGKEVWAGKYNLKAKKSFIDGRPFDAAMVRDMLTAALKSIST